VQSLDTLFRRQFLEPKSSCSCAGTSNRQLLVSPPQSFQKLRTGFFEVLESSPAADNLQDCRTLLLRLLPVRSSTIGPGDSARPLLLPPPPLLVTITAGLGTEHGTSRAEADPLLLGKSLARSTGDAISADASQTTAQARLSPGVHMFAASLVLTVIFEEDVVAESFAKDARTSQ